MLRERHGSAVEPAVDDFRHSVHLFSALRAGDPDLFIIGFCIPAFRKSRAGKESSMRSVFDHHIAAAHITDHICHFILDIYFFEFLFRRVNILLQIRVEITDNCLRLYRSRLHTVQKAFHHGGKMYVHNAWERLLHNVVYHLAQFRYIEILLFF